MEVSKLQIVECFVLYSILGWLVESAYMSVCTKKLTNRGFGFGPFCPIYGFGASLGAVLLSPFRYHPLLLFVVAAVGATAFEYIVGRLMQFTLGDFWWDYNEKPFNYKGIICLESTCGWGLYGLGVVYRVHPMMLTVTRMIPPDLGLVLCIVILSSYMIDFLYHVLLALHVDLEQTAIMRTQHRAVEFAKEKTGDMMVKVGQKKDHAKEIVLEKREAFTDIMTEKKDAFTGMMTEKKDQVSGMMHETKDVVTRQVSRRRDAVLNWYRTHRWK
ncbi:MAG: putative ABC transporter permease [Lachnospiraceae bacterium]|nr:putative ABC transporter permease [Lachnospiraceae bacterium]